jgi:heme/copper-type cytochrome/quinol oxidase subunit 3
LTFWYWHFVDIIWILLYACMYIGSWPFGYSNN